MVLVELFKKKKKWPKVIVLRTGVEVPGYLGHILQAEVKNLVRVQNADPSKIGRLAAMISDPPARLTDREKYCELLVNPAFEEITAIKPETIDFVVLRFLPWHAASIMNVGGRHIVVCPIEGMDLDDFLNEE